MNRRRKSRPDIPDSVRAFFVVFAIGTFLPTSIACQTKKDLPIPRPVNTVIEVNLGKSGDEWHGENEISLTAPPSDQIQFRILNPAGRISSGSIYTRINTNSANVITTFHSLPDNGLLGKMQLRLRPGFEFLRGHNTVEIYGVDEYDNYYYSSFLVHVPGESPSRDRVTTAYPKGERWLNKEMHPGKVWAVCIGISDYTNEGEGITDLPAATKDAVTFATTLRKRYGELLPEENLLVLTDQNANLTDVRSALFTFLNKADEDDLVFIYFAGHGAPDPIRLENYYLLLSNSSPRNMGGTGLPMWDMQTALKRGTKANKVVVLTDACHSGAILERSEGVYTRGIAVNYINQHISLMTGAEKHLVIAASGINQVSLEGDEWNGHGAFTYHLIKAFDGDGDTNGDRLLTALELARYLKEQVAKSTGGLQTPMASITEKDDFLLASFD